MPPAARIRFFSSRSPLDLHISPLYLPGATCGEDALLLLGQVRLVVVGQVEGHHLARVRVRVRVRVNQVKRSCYGGALRGMRPPCPLDWRP